MSSDEHQPLLQDVDVAPFPPRKYRANTCTRFLYICSACIFWVLCIHVLVFAFIPRTRVSWPTFGGPPVSWPRRPIEIDSLERDFLSVPNAQAARGWSQWYTSGPHLAGKNLSQAVYTKQKFEEFGFASSQVDIVAYEIYLNYPKDHGLKLLQSKKGEYKVLYEASLAEDVLEEDPTTGLADRIPTFHGYSANGNVTGPLVYANYGTFADFATLQAQNISIKGAIVICRYGKIFRGIKVQRAQSLGAIGVIVYSDPRDDFGVTPWKSRKGVEPKPEYPDGPSRQHSAVQRGSVNYLSIASGDPTTPGWPSLPGCKRLPLTGRAPDIPSLPISYADAVPLLKSLNGCGRNASDIGGEGWVGALTHFGVDYSVGPCNTETKSPSSKEVVVNLYNEQEYVTTPLWDVIAVINGTLYPDEAVVLGNHRDAWIAGGASDPNSGSAALLELARGYGKLLQQGWKPKRTIVLASWDGEEYALIGSTEWVEQYAPWLNRSAIAYFNLDSATTGAQGGLQVSASPLVNSFLRKTLQSISDPNSVADGKNATLYDVWSKRISTMGSGSDFTAFQDYIGIPSLNFGFGNVHYTDSAVYHYHSNYDSFHWMDKFGDPSWEYHTTAAKLLGLLALRMAEAEVIPFNTSEYAQSLITYLADTLNGTRAGDPKGPSTGDFASISGYSQRQELHWPAVAADSNSPIHPPSPHLKPSLNTLSFSASTSSAERQALHALSSLNSSLHSLLSTAQVFESHSYNLSSSIAHNPPRWWNLPKRIKLFAQLRAINSAYLTFERAFTYEGGLDGRPLYKHVVFAPGKWTGYAGDTFPGLVEALHNDEGKEKGADWESVQRWAQIIQASVRKGEKVLEEGIRKAGWRFHQHRG